MERYGKWIIAALSLSLMVNVFAAGHLLGGGLKSRPGQEKIDFGRGLPRGVIQAMPPAAKEAFRKSIQASRKEVRIRRREVRELRASLPGIVGRSGPLDVAALEQRFEKLRALSGGMQGGFEAALISALSVMTQEERATFAAELEKASKRGPRKGGPGGGPGGGPERGMPGEGRGGPPPPP